MNRIQKKQLKRYKNELILVALAGFVSITLLGVSFSFNNEITGELEQLKYENAVHNRKINDLVDAKQLLKDIGSKFDAIKINGFYGNEDRLSWAEALKGSSLRLKLPNLKYSISPQETVMELAVGFLPGLLLSQSIMKIEADLLHEGDLLSLSAALSAEPGLYRLLGCELEKGDDISVNTIQKNVSLTCSLAWYTVKHDSSQDSPIEEDIDLEI